MCYELDKLQRSTPQSRPGHKRCATAELADKVPNRVLSRQTVGNIVSAKSIVAQKQLAANLPEKQHIQHCTLMGHRSLARVTMFT